MTPWLHLKNWMLEVKNTKHKKVSLVFLNGRRYTYIHRHKNLRSKINEVLRNWLGGDANTSAHKRGSK